MTQADNHSVTHCNPAQYLSEMGGVSTITEGTSSEPNRIVPHPRTLRKAREQIKQMVNSGVSLRRTKSYLDHWCRWWVRTSETWQYQELILWFLEVCWEPNALAIASTLLHQHIKKSGTFQTLVPAPVFEVVFAIDR